MKFLIFTPRKFEKLQIPRKIFALDEFYWGFQKNSARAGSLEVGLTKGPGFAHVETSRTNSFTGDIIMAHQTEADQQAKLYELKVAKQQEYSEKLRTATTEEEKKYFAKKMMKFSLEASGLARKLHNQEQVHFNK